ncbi:MAG: hypothetical protein IKP73_06700 [Bacteroidales bacterium]|nr:hypothetical protein [Bacteroidales bacterium]
MKRIQEVYSKDIFTFMNNFIRTTIYFKSQNNSAITTNEKAFDAEVGSDGNVNGNVNFSQLTDRQKNIISIIKDGSQITAKNYPENGSNVGSNGSVSSQYVISKLNISERTIFRELAELKRLGYIVRIGSGKNGAWKVAGKSIVENEKGSQKTTQETTQENGSDAAQEKITILSDMQRAILLYLNDHPKANRIELTGAIPNASADGIKYNLARLQLIGLLKRIGSTRYGHWEVVLSIR